jgi:hypothetical protein
LGIFWFFVLQSWATWGHAQDDAATRAAARKLAEDGVAALQAGDAATAVQKLDKAFRTLQAPSIALWSGRALVKQGKLVEAAERLLEATRLPTSGDTQVQQQAKADADKELEQLRPRIPNLVVAIEGAGENDVTVTLDGKAMPSSLLGEEQPANPGLHRLLGKRGNEEQTTEVTLAEGERKQVVLRFGASAGGGAAAATAATPDAGDSAATAAAPDKTTGGGKRTLAFVALAAGGAGLVLGGVTGALALSKRSELDDSPSCRDGKCLNAVEADVSSLRTFRTLSTVGFIAGGALAATGVVLLLTSGSSAEQGSGARSRLALGVGPGQLQLEGSF